MFCFGEILLVYSIRFNSWQWADHILAVMYAMGRLVLVRLARMPVHDALGDMLT